MKKVLLLLLVMLFVHIYSVSAKVFTISDKTTEKEMKKVLGMLQAKDTLLLKAGYYRMNFKLNNLHGAPDCPIVIRGEGRNVVTIDGGSPEPGSDLTNYGIHLRDCSWIVIDNLSFRNCWVDAIRIDDSSYITLTNSNVEGSRRAVYALGRKSHHFLIENCYWEQGEHVWTKENQYSWEELHHGKFRHYNGSIFQAKMISGSFVIRDNYIKNVYNGIRLSIMGDAEQDTLACTNGEVYRNVIENSADNAFEPEVYCKNLHFYHNKMINSHAFISLTEVGGGPLYFYGNTGVKLPDCKDGWTIFKFIGKERRFTRPLYIFNNSWQVNSDVLGRIQESHWNNDYIHHFNNAYYISEADTVGIYYLGTDNVFENDCANIPFPSLVTETARHKSILADPMFMDGKYGNFLLKENSPCRGSGMIPQDVEVGFTGDKLDIGAYDDDKLVEGPPFRYENPGIEMPDKEKPRIVRHKVEDGLLKLWLSSPLNPSTVHAEEFTLYAGNAAYTFSDYSLLNDNYLLVLKSSGKLPKENISLSVGKKPIGDNGEVMTLWASTLPASLVTNAESALNITRRVADKLIESVSFDIKPRLVTFNANVSTLKVSKEMLRDNQVTYGLITIHTDKAKDAILGFSFRGDIQVLLNNTLVYKGVSGVEDFKEYTYNRFKFANQLNIHLQKGENHLLVKCIGRNEDMAFSCCIQKENDRFDDEVVVRNNTNNPYINNWLIAGPFLAGDKKEKEPVFEPERLIKEYYLQGDRLISWQLQSPMLQQNLDIPASIGKSGFTADWNYANSNTLLGILNVYKATNDATYRHFVEMYNKHIVDNYEFFKEQYFSKRILRGTYFRLFRATMLDDTSGSALSLAEMATIHPSKGLQRELLDSTLNYVLIRQARLPDGTLCRPEPIENTVWADDLFMSVAFLLRMAKVNNAPELYDEIASQILRFNKYLSDGDTQLYRHGWYNQEKKLSAVSWSRANGWVIWATSEALLAMPASHKDYKKIQSLFVKHLKAILSYQSEGGLWHQVLTRPDSYLETSGSAMFAIGLSRAIRRGWLPSSYSPQLLKAWKAVSEEVNEDGTVSKICCGTDMNEDVNYYMKQPTVTSDPRGMGAVLTLGVEMSYYFTDSQKNK